MIAFISGILEMKLNGYIVIDVGGVGYKVFMSEAVIETLGELGEKVKVYTHQHVREDDISLYGFITMEELNMFELLISVSGVGAKSALTILANIEPSAFALAVITNDTSKLVKIPGVGPKSAARIVLELKDKLKNQDLVDKKDVKVKVVDINNENIDEAISALQVLGYPQRDAMKAVNSVDTADLSVEDIIKKALLYFAKN